jgi:Fe-S cluster biogenesis protein NfuA
MALHRSLLQRLLELSGDPAHQGSPALLDAFADDPLVGPLLLTHDLHPYDLHERLTRALARLRPRLEWNGCRATIAGVEPPIVRVRLEGAQLSLHSTLTPLVEAMLLEAAPELTRVILEGEAVAAPATPLLQIMRHPPVPAGGGAP